MSKRPEIPATLTRQLMIESGYRCSIPSCREATSLEIDHIVEWAKVKNHKYENLIVLCRNHHGQKKSTSTPRDLNQISLKIIKQNQMELTGRYSDVERRVIEYFVRNPDERLIVLPGSFEVLLMHLLDSDIIEKEFESEGSVVLLTNDSDSEPTPENSIVLREGYTLTAHGLAMVNNVRDARGISS